MATVVTESKSIKRAQGRQGVRYCATTRSRRPSTRELLRAGARVAGKYAITKEDILDAVREVRRGH